MQQHEYPADWNPGELLNLRRYTDCTYVATRLLEDPLEDKSNCKWFSNPYEAQEFISWWYAGGAVRDNRYGPARSVDTGQGEAADTDKHAHKTLDGSRTWEGQNDAHAVPGRAVPAKKVPPRPRRGRHYGSW